MVSQEAPELETARLRLRGHRLSDFDAYFAMWSDPAVVRFIGGEPFSREAAWSRFLRLAGMWHHMGFGSFLIEERASGAFVGEFGFQEFRRAITPSIEGTMETGWALSPAFHGKGMAEEGELAAIRWARAAHPDKRITCFIDPQNERSQRLARRLGFVEYGRGEYHGASAIMFELPPS